MAPVAVFQLESVLIVDEVPSVYSITSWAEYQGEVPQRWPPPMPRPPEYQPLPITAPSALAPCRTEAVTS